MRNPEFDMEDRMLLNKIDYEKGTIVIDSKKYNLTDNDFPTINPKNPYKLSEDEQELVDQLKESFKQSEKLQKHIKFLYTKGTLFKIYNSNLLFHGCVPLNEDGSFVEINLSGEKVSGKAFFEKAEILARKAYFAKEGTIAKEKGQDFMWYLWCGKNSPLFGRSRMTIFERYFIADKDTWIECKNPYYKYTNNKEFCNLILKEFGLDSEKSHIINGHMPVKTKDGENPVKADGKLIVIDGGLCKAYRQTTGIAGYTLIFNSKRMRIVSHEAIGTKEEIISENRDITPKSVVFEIASERIKVSETDIGIGIREKVADLEKLLQAYYEGTISIDSTKQ
jgi:fructose-1,6-bisphosphatase-3